MVDMKHFQLCVVASNLLTSFSFPLLTYQTRRNELSRTNISMKMVFDEQSTNGRRNFLNLSSLATIAITPPLFPSLTLAEELSYTTYEDEKIGFQIKTPTNWERSENSLPDRRRIVLFMDKSDSSQEKDLMFIAYTPVRDDFTSLSSMGTVDQVGQMTILPKGELAGVESDNKMLSAVSQKNSYYFDYVSKIPGQPKRHFRTIFSLAQGATGGAGAVLVTITAQTTEDRYLSLQKGFDEIIDSYEKTKK